MDRAACRFVLFMLGLLGAFQWCCAGRALASQPGLVDGDYCDAPGEPHERWDAQARARTRARVQAACKALGASPIVCAYYDAIVVRESYGGAASVRHTQGKGENGLGPMGLSLDWHAGKWEGTDEDPAFCTPEVSVVVAHAIFHRAVSVYDADSIADLQAIYAGRFRCIEVDHFGWLGRLPLLGPVIARWLPAPERECMAAPSARGDEQICDRMAARDYNCHEPITAADLGRAIPVERRRSWALAQARASTGR